ncbi:hypothetical protein M7I_3597 [Glarea lozoyensis 74030]|uniref:Uncharacterized protein n=1 Tax=Glarea lozoyensis (strain ATCC 74030 / MF5533) TaxID=1104152 RepID=H0ELX4_GLAL7|nr:hypothetical protein M7I_3597 [Glarea lozoyensis 74030]
MNGALYALGGSITLNSARIVPQQCANAIPPSSTSAAFAELEFDYDFGIIEHNNYKWVFYEHHNKHWGHHFLFCPIKHDKFKRHIYQYQRRIRNFVAFDLLYPKYHKSNIFQLHYQRWRHFFIYAIISIK